MRREYSGIKNPLSLCPDPESRYVQLMGLSRSIDGRPTTVGDEKLDAMVSAGNGWESGEFTNCNCTQDKLRQITTLLID